MGRGEGCEECGKMPVVGWRLECEVCRLKSCGECRGHWVERSFGSIEGVMKGEVGEFEGEMKGMSLEGWGL